MGRKKSEMWKCICEHEFDGDVLITDPCYLRHGGSYDGPGWDPKGTEMFVRECGGMYSTTYCGDWECAIYRTKGVRGRIPRGAECLGYFCADAGLVCVIDMKDALARSSGFGDWLMVYGHCGAVIMNFKGKVSFLKRSWKVKLRGHVYTETELRVHGKGTVGGEPISFESKQISM